MKRVSSPAALLLFKPSVAAAAAAVDAVDVADVPNEARREIVSGDDDSATVVVDEFVDDDEEKDCEEGTRASDVVREVNDGGSELKIITIEREDGIAKVLVVVEGAAVVVVGAVSNMSCSDDKE